MKKTVKRLLVLLLALSMTIVAPVKINAKTITDYPQGVTLYPKNSPSYSEKQDLGIYCSKTKIKGLKNSNKSVANVTVGKSDNGYSIYVQPKKVGTTTISYKVGKDTHKRKLVVKKYVNPYKQIKINGKDITSKFNKTNICVLSYKQYKGKTIKLSFKRKGYWYMHHGDYIEKGSEHIHCIGSMSDPSTFKVKKKGSIAYLWTEDNSLNGDERAEDCRIIFK